MYLSLQMIATKFEVGFVLVVYVALCKGYAVPKARIEVLHPKGFAVSIPVINQFVSVFLNEFVNE